jgi:predicted dehydrogenase
MKKIGLGVIGAGGIVRSRHVPGWRRVEGLEVVAVANARRTTAEAFVKETGYPARVLDTWEEVIQAPDVDAVWIGATPYLHHPATLAALAAGKHVFCQARMAMNLAEAREMQAAAAARPDLVTMLCPPPFGLAEDAWMKSLLAREPVGRLFQVRLRSWQGAFLDGQQPAHWRQRVEISGQNILTLGIFVEVLQRWFGAVKRVRAQSGTVHPLRGDYAVRIPDWLEVGLEFASGLAGVASFSGVHAGAPINDLLMEGTGGHLHFNFDESELWKQPTGSEQSARLLPDRPLPEWRVEEEFFAAVRDPSAPRPHPDFVDGVAYMAVIDAVHRSLADRGGWMEVETP